MRMREEVNPIRPARRGRYWVRRWHRWLGVIFLGPLLWLTLSGLMLRYAEELGLDEAIVGSGRLLEHYGMIPEGVPRVVVAGEREVGEWGEVLFLDGQMLDEVGDLRGAVDAGGQVVVATEDYLLVYDLQGEWEQKLGEESLPGVPIEALGMAGDGRVLVRVDGRVWKFDDDLIVFTEIAEVDGLRWSVPEPGLEDQFAAELAAQAGIPWSRVVLDLHSGNLGGTGGKLLVDVTGLAVIVLSLFGVKLVFRKPRA